jgi:hypothetical protein
VAIRAFGTLRARAGKIQLRTPRQAAQWQELPWAVFDIFQSTIPALSIVFLLSIQ